jgi:hypothetical protein
MFVLSPAKTPKILWPSFETSQIELIEHSNFEIDFLILSVSKK